MRDLAGTGNCPAIRVVQGTANLAFHRAAWVIRDNQFQTIRTSVFHFIGKLQTGFAAENAFAFRFDGRFSQLCGYRLDPGLEHRAWAFF